MLQKIFRYPPIQRYLPVWMEKKINQGMQKAFGSLEVVYLIQIGANDGLRYDPVRKLIQQYPCRALLAEPVPYIFEQLQANYASFPQVKLWQTAVADSNTNKVLPFYCFQPKPPLPFNSDFSLWGSFEEAQISKFKSLVPHYEELLACIEVPVTEINELIASANFSRLDMLQIDAEGWDIRLMNILDLEHWQPSLIRFEHLHAPKNEVYALLEKLWQHEYSTYSIGLDTLVVHPRWKKFFKSLEIIKKIHSAWLLPSR